ncbi:MAG: tetratricopeptide repeat protein [Sedimentisphaerales bacterium]|nr:tetratricopeptide repeat protein [Sedimentisphaerales bacterium]
MEQVGNYNIDLYAETIPSFEQIKELEQFVRSSGANIEQFASKIEDNMSRTASSAVLATGIGLYILGKYDKAVEKLAKADDCKEKFYYIALAKSHRGDYDKAIENLDAAAKAGADKLLVNLEKADVYRKAGNYERAQRQMKECSNFQGVSADFHYQQGRIMEKQGEYAQAVENYQKAIELNPNHADALFHLAYRCDLSGDEEAAIDYYKQAVSKQPVHVNALLNLAVLYEDLQKFGKAMNCINKVLKYHPNHHRAILFWKDIESSMTMFYDEEKEKRRSRKSQMLETPISDFELSVRSRNCLRKMNIFTIGDLLNITEAELLSYKNFGETSLREIKQILQSKSLQLGQSIEEPVIEPDQQDEQEQQADGILSKPVDDLNLSVRARKCLAKLNIRNLGDLTRKTEAELLGCKNFGVTSLNEIKKAISGIDLSLRTLD